MLKPAALVALFLAAFVANLRLAGTSPIVWVDTFNDEIEVRQCLANNSCTLTGMSTSVPGQAAAVTWLEMRTLLAWLGVGLDGTHLVVQLLNAFAVVLVFLLTTELGGPLAGAAAAWIFMDHIEALVRVTALHNSNLLLFLGAVFVLACTAVVKRPGVPSVALVALVGAVMANVHLACVATGASVVWVALTARRRRLLLATLGAVVFVLATYAVAPPTWHHNLINLLERPSSYPVSTMTVLRNPMMGWALFAIGAWVASLASRAPAFVQYRRQSQGALAVLVPLLAALLVAPRFGLHAESKYLFHAKAACAVAAALPLTLVAGAILRAVSVRWFLRPIEQVVPFAAALVIALPGVLGAGGQRLTAADERRPTIGDLVTVAGILRSERGWDVGRMVEHLKTPYGAALLSGLRQMAAAGDAPTPVVADVGSSALLMVLETADLPDPLPPSWKIVRRSSRAVTVLVFTQSGIDWSQFVLCVQPDGESEQHCAETGWRSDQEPFVANMPPSGVGWRGTMELRLPLRRMAPGFTGEIFMPRMAFVCGGRIVSASDGGLRVDADGRRATMSTPEVGDPSPPTITLQWRIASLECDDGVPPFFVEGDAATVRTIEAILRKREG